MNIIAIYPGRFQPFSKHHAATFMWLEKQFGKKNCYIVTSNSVDEKSPLDFNEKSALINMYGFYNIIESKEPYNIDYVVKALNLDINDTAIVVLLGEKDKNRLNTGLKKDGTPSYYTKYTNNNEDLLPISQKGYVLIMPHVSINVNNEELNGTYVRKYLGDISIPEQERKTAFKEIFGWYSDKFFQYLTQKFTGNNLNEVKIMTPESYRGYEELLPVYDKLIDADINCTWELSTDLTRDYVEERWKHTIIIVHDIPDGKYNIDYIRAAGKYKNPRLTLSRAKLFNNKYYVHDITSGQSQYYYAQIPKLIDDIKKKTEGNNLNEIKILDGTSKQYNINQFLKYFKDYDVQLATAYNTPPYTYIIKDTNISTSIRFNDEHAIIKWIDDKGAGNYKKNEEVFKYPIDWYAMYRKVIYHRIQYNPYLKHLMKTESLNEVKIVSFEGHEETVESLLDIKSIILKDFKNIKNLRLGKSPLEIHSGKDFPILRFDIDNKEYQIYKSNDDYALIKSGETKIRNNYHNERILLDNLYNLNYGLDKNINLKISEVSGVYKNRKRVARSISEFQALCQKNPDMLIDIHYDELNPYTGEVEPSSKRIGKYSDSKYKGDPYWNSNLHDPNEFEQLITNKYNRFVYIQPYNHKPVEVLKINILMCEQLQKVDGRFYEELVKREVHPKVQYRVLNPTTSMYSFYHRDRKDSDNSHETEVYETFSKDWWNSQLINEIKIFEYPNLKTLNQFIEELLKINPDIEYEFRKSSYISGKNSDSPDGSFIYLYFENNGTPYIVVTGRLNPNEIYTTSRFHYKLPGKISYLHDINLGTNIAIAAKDFYEDFLIKSESTPINEVKVLDGKSIEYNIIKFKQYFKDYDVQILDNITLRVELENFMLLVEFSNDIAEVIYINPLKLMGEDNRVNGLINLFYPIDFTKLQAAIDSVDLEENINEIFSKEYWTKNLVLEGGSGGHMAHIFDLPQINTGKDLENAFKVTAKHVESNAASVKIDGVNASVRIVNDEFVLDRGSNKPLDVKGVTTQDLENRFGLGHGFIKTGTEVLKIFNEGLPYTKSELTSLGLLTNPNLMFNVEYVAGQTNVQSYDENFIAIHNILEIYQATPKRRATKEISYDKSVLESYVKKLSKVAAKYGFRVVHEFSTNNTTPINFRPVLSEALEFTSNGKVVKNTLHNWLTLMKLPKGIKVKFNDGKVVDAISKHVLTTVLSNNNLDELAERQYHEDIINGFLTYYATMKLGDVILQSLNSDLGPLNTQEGIVVKDSPLGQTFKITGQFILSGMNSKFRS